MIVLCVDEAAPEWGVGITETEILERAKEASMIRKQSEKDLAESIAQDREKIEPHSPRSKGVNLLQFVFIDFFFCIFVLCMCSGGYHLFQYLPT